MFLTVNLITGSKARVTNDQRVECFGFELQWLPRTLFWQCQIQGSGWKPAHTYRKAQRLCSPQLQQCPWSSYAPTLQPKSDGKFLTSNAPANILKAQLSALKPLTWNRLSSYSPTLHAKRIHKDRICCCFKDWHSIVCSAWLWIAGSTLQVVFSAVFLLVLNTKVLSRIISFNSSQSRLISALIGKFQIFLACCCCTLFAFDVTKIWAVWICLRGWQNRA